VNSNKIILDLCGGTGEWSKPYKKAGYDVKLITLPQHDVRLYEPPKNVYGILAAPPCTMFSFARTKARDMRNLYEAMNIVIACLRIIWTCQYGINNNAQKRPALKFWALENPNGFLKYFLGCPVIEFNPWEFGDEYQKKTHLWGYFNKPQKTTKLKPKGDLALYKSLTPAKRVKFDMLKTKDIHPEFYGKLTRQERRAITPAGFAKAFFETNQ